MWGKVRGYIVQPVKYFEQFEHVSLWNWNWTAIILVLVEHYWHWSHAAYSFFHQFHFWFCLLSLHRHCLASLIPSLTNADGHTSWHLLQTQKVSLASAVYSDLLSMRLEIETCGKLNTLSLKQSFLKTHQFVWWVNNSTIHCKTLLEINFFFFFFFFCLFVFYRANMKVSLYFLLVVFLNVGVAFLLKRFNFFPLKEIVWLKKCAHKFITENDSSHSNLNYHVKALMCQLFPSKGCFRQNKKLPWSWQYFWGSVCHRSMMQITFRPKTDCFTPFILGK